MSDETTRPVHGLPEWVRRVGMGSWYFLGFCAAVALLAALVAATQTITVPLALSAFLAVTFSPLVDRLDERGVPRTAGSIAVVALIGGIAVGAVVLIAAGLAGQGEELAESMDGAIDTIEGWLDDLDIDPGLADDSRQSIDDASGTILQGVLTGVLGVVNSAVGLAAGLLLGVVMLYYLLKDGAALVDAFAARQGPTNRGIVERVAHGSAASVRAYFRGRTILAAIVGVTIALAAAALGMPLVFAIGLVNFVGGYIPYLGAFVGGAFAALIALSDGGLGQAITIVVIILVVQNVLEEVLEPRIVGEELRMHPLAVLIATLLGGLLAGMVGLILAAPVTAIAVHTYRELGAAGFFDETSEGRRGDSG